VARKIEDLDRALAAARLAVLRPAARSAQASVIDATRSPSASEGAVRSMSSPSAMRIGAARWWPLHTLQIASAGSRAEWWLEALVAQASAEDWDGVRLGLSTAT